MTTTDPRRAIDAVWRIESPRLIAGLARLVRDVGLAEDLAQDALVAALQQWPESGVPDNPGAWLMAVGKRRAVDHFRRSAVAERKHEEIGRAFGIEQETAGQDLEAAVEDDFGDDLLRLIFIACHPVLSTDGRVALTLRLLGGLTTEEIARAYLVPESTVAQRIVRAKRTLAETRVPFEVPTGADVASRLSSVLEVIYLIFNEGYAATGGEDWIRPPLCDEALRLGRVLAELMPGESEVHGLVALMEIQASRFRARVAPGGEPVLLLDQDRSRWDHQPRWRGPKPWGAGSARIRCRPPSRRAMHGRGSRRTRTGSASWRSTTRSRRSLRRRSLSSIVRSRWAWPSVPPQGSSWWKRWHQSRCWTGITFCRACGVICCRSWTDSTRLARSSSGPPRSRGTHASVSSCWSGPRRARATAPGEDRDRTGETGWTNGTKPS